MEVRRAEEAARGGRPGSSARPCARPELTRRPPSALRRRGGVDNNFVARLLLRVHQKITLHARRPPAAMLHFIGLGLADEKDITVRGLEIVKNAERVYLEAYTAVLLVDKERLVSLRCLPRRPAREG